MSFSALGLHPQLLATLEQLAYQQPTDIQQAAIPEILANHDVMAGAQTGTGKTAAFVLPLIHRLLDSQAEASIHALVLTPTRELAQQVQQSVQRYAQDTQIKSVVAYGGASINPQLEALRNGCHILVATPGRLLELLMKNLIDISTLQTLVLDEADRMLDMGFIIDIQRILKKLPEEKQTLFFSATFNDEIFALSKSLLNQPKLIEVSQRNTRVEKIEQRVYSIDKAKKSAFIAYLIGSKNWHQVLVFTRTKQGADALAKEMQKDGIKTQAIHGDKSQGARDKALAEFKSGACRALVATDVAARGLDIAELQYVINHELPYQAEDYIHRIGRTGRAGAGGLAISLVSPAEAYLLADIETLLQESLISQWFPGFEPSQTETASPKRKPSKKTLREKALGKTRTTKKKSSYKSK